MPNVTQWGDVECDMLVEERLRRNQEYHNIVGRSRVVPIDISYDSDEDDKGDDEIYDEEDDEGDDGADDNSGKGVIDYDINDLIGDDDCE